MKQLLIFLCLTSSLIAQPAANCGEYGAFVGALDRHWQVINNLATENFRVSYRGGTASVMSSSYRVNPAGRVVVLLDMSASMIGLNGRNKWRLANSIASDFVTSAPPRQQISLMTFASEVEQRFPASSGRKPIEDWLASPLVRDGKTVKGGTALFDTILAAIDELRPSQPGDSIYVITDSDGDTYSKATKTVIERALLDSGTRLFGFVLNVHLPLRGLEQAGPEFDWLARRSGGFLISLNALPIGLGNDWYKYNDQNLKAIETWTHIIQQQMSEFYVLTIKVSGASKQKDWSLELVDAQGHKRKDVVLTYPGRPVDCLMAQSK